MLLPVFTVLIYNINRRVCGEAFIQDDAGEIGRIEQVKTLVIGDDDLSVLRPAFAGNDRIDANVSGLLGMLSGDAERRQHQNGLIRAADDFLAPSKGRARLTEPGIEEHRRRAGAKAELNRCALMRKQRRRQVEIAIEPGRDEGPARSRNDVVIGCEAHAATFAFLTTPHASSVTIG